MNADGGGRQLWQDLDDLAAEHHRDGVGYKADDEQVVADKNHRQPKPVAQVEEEIEYLGPDRHVECADGFICNEYSGLSSQGAGNADPLALPAGKI